MWPDRCYAMHCFEGSSLRLDSTSLTLYIYFMYDLLSLNFTAFGIANAVLH